ncbi:MAG TPA: hypothetical protein VML94_04970 [Thermoplasmata archaeon]|nr:hypothetical protein [Thermoplasmata archaeon]
MSATYSPSAPPSEPVGGAAPVHGPSLSAAFHRDLAAAQQALAAVGRRLRRSRRLGPGEAVIGGVPSSDLVARMEKGLAKEHALVLGPLLARLEAFAALLNKDRDVPAKAIEEGLALIDRYLVEMHDVHLRLLERARADPARGPSAALTLLQLTSDHERARVRWATVRVMLRGYEGRVSGYRALLGLTLADECQAELAWHDLEEEYVRTSLPPAFPPAVADLWGRDLDRFRDAGRADRIRVDEYLARTEPLLAPPSPAKR